MASPVRSGGARDGRVEVRGLRELQSALRAADQQLPRLLRVANRNVAETVARTARSRAEALGGVAAKTAPSIRAAAEQRAAKISFGGARYPFAGGANFGAYHDLPRNTARGVVRGWNQFPEWGGNQFTGGANDRFIYWTIRREHDRIVAAYEDELARLARTIEEHR
jgi:hypothetical protein